jgi:PAS domain-containing protein
MTTIPSLKPVLRSSSDAILLFDRNLRIAGVNAAARKVLGKPGQKLLGKPYGDIFRLDAGDGGAALFQSPGSAFATDTVYMHAAGIPRALAIRTIQLNGLAGKLEGVFAVIKLVARR